MSRAVMNRTLDAVVAGHICLDITPDLGKVDLQDPSDFFTPGQLLTAGAVSLSTGGVVSNTGLNMIRLGMRVALMGKVGDDPLGGLVRDLLERRWADSADPPVRADQTVGADLPDGPSLIVGEGAATGYSVILAPGGFDRMFLHASGANDTFGAGDIDYDLVSRARLFHFGYPPVMKRMHAQNGKELCAAFERIKSGGATTSLDMALPDPKSSGGRVDWAGVLAAVLPHVDLFLPSVEELLFMLDRARFDAIRARGPEGGMPFFSSGDLHEFGSLLLGLGAKVVVIKCGSRGLYLRTAPVLENLGRAAPGDVTRWAGREFRIPAFRVDEPVNATGSGDAAIAGFLTAFLRGLPARFTLESAAAAGAASLTAPDSLSGMMSWDRLRAAIDGGWPTEPLEVDREGWRRDGVRWIGPAHS